MFTWAEVGRGRQNIRLRKTCEQRQRDINEQSGSGNDKKLSARWDSGKRQDLIQRKWPDSKGLINHTKKCGFHAEGSRKLLKVRRKVIKH